MSRLRLIEISLMSQLILVVGAFAGSNMQDNVGSDSAALAGTTWILTALSGQKLSSGPQITLQFGSDGTLNGSDGCNRYRGNFSADGSTLQFSGKMISTMMACPEPEMNRARAYTAALQQTAAFAIDGNRLSVRNSAGDDVAIFEADSMSLAGTAWRVIAYNNGAQAVVSILDGTQITATFTEDGRVTGSAGCNRYFAAYETENSSVTIGRPGSTRRLCTEPHGIMDQEARFLEALHAAATFQLEGERLWLRTADGALSLNLIRETPTPSPSKSVPQSKIQFDLDKLHADGLRGPPGGLRALHYEYCIPDRADAIHDVSSIDATLQIQRGSPGRVGCREGTLLCLGHTHQIDHRTVLEALAALPYVAEIHEAFFE